MSGNEIFPTGIVMSFVGHVYFFSSLVFWLTVATLCALAWIYCAKQDRLESQQVKEVKAHD